MRKFFNRPFLALAVVFGLVFLFILIRAYFNVIDSLSESLFNREYDPKDTFEFEDERHQEHQEWPVGVVGPQLPIKMTATKKIEITLGTFPALADSCFLQRSFNYAKFCDSFDDFEDLQKIVRMFPHEVEDIPSAPDTLGEILELDFSSEPNSLDQFLSEVNRYQLYSKKSRAVDDVIYDMKTRPFRSIVELTDEDMQFRMVVKFVNHVEALFKPIRVTFEQQADNQMYIPEYEKHTSEIAAYHVDRILGFNKAMPVVGRRINMIVDMLRIAPPNLQRTFWISPKPDENVCFSGNCDKFCDSYHPICGNGTSLEGSFMAYFPEEYKRETKTHPWAQSQSGQMWETDPEYCGKMVESELYSSGRLLLELIDMSVFDFLIGNGDRRSYERFEAFEDDSFPIRLDHGKAFGRAHHDELKILAPLLQCCLIKSSTLQTLLEVHNSEKPLSARMRESMANDPLAPILWSPHLDALDRRLATVLQAVRDCIERKSVDDVLITTDTVRFT